MELHEGGRGSNNSNLQHEVFYIIVACSRELKMMFSESAETFWAPFYPPGESGTDGEKDRDV